MNAIFLYFMIIQFTTTVNSDLLNTEITPTKTSCSNGILTESNCFLFKNEHVNIRDAEAECVKSGGHLISIHDNSTNELIRSLAQKYLIQASDMWIGLHFIVDWLNNTIDNWQWVDNTIDNYNNWADGEPKKPIKGLVTNCAVLSAVDGKWISIDCYEKKPYMCNIIENNFTPSPVVTAPTTTSGTTNTVATTSAISFCYNGILIESSCLFFVNEPLTYQQAEKKCVTSGGHLVSIHDNSTNEIVRSLGKLYLNQSRDTDVWIGLFNFNPTKNWTWTDNTKYNFKNWENGPPQYGLCVFLSVINGTWRQSACSQNFSYICRVTKVNNLETSTIATTISAITYKKMSTTVELENSETTNTVETTSAISSCSNGILIESSCLFFVNELLTFQKAEDKCVTSGGHLVSIHDNSTNEIVRSLGKLYINLYTRTDIWIGLFNFNPTNCWTWADNTNYDFKNWVNGPPQSLRHPCVLLSVINGTWRQSDCSQNFSYICRVTKVNNLETSTIATTISAITYTEMSTTVATFLTTVSTLPPDYENSTSPKNKINSLYKWWYIGGSLAVTILAGVIIFGFFRRRRQVHQKNRQNTEEKSRRSFAEKIEASPLEARLSTEERQRNYINKKWIQYDCNEVVGKGASAVVYKGSFKIDQNKKSKNTIKKYDEIYTVALKIPINFVTNDDIEEFVRELDALIKIESHPNIIKFYGWTLELQIPVLITELAEMNLLEFVRNCRGNELPVKKILSILWQITLALEHIASLSMVHRDVACRNILLTKSCVARLTDFGLCCQCDESFTYRASLHKRLPLKWCSIEALVDRIFSEKSDVWSFGVLCYEAFSFGAVPFPALSNVEMLESLQAGKRLEKPEKASDEMYKLMLRCWQEKPVERPNFKELSECLRIFLENETCDYGYLTLDVIPDNRKIKIMDEI